MLHNGSGFVMKLITPSMMAIVIIVSPVLIFVLYFIFFVLLVFFLHLSFFSIFIFFFYICIFLLRLFFFSTFVFLYTRVVFPGWGVCFSRFGSGFFLLVMFFLVFLFLLVFLVCSCGAGLWSGCSCLGAFFPVGLEILGVVHVPCFGL